MVGDSEVFLLSNASTSREWMLLDRKLCLQQCCEELIGKINFAHYRQFVKADKTNRVTVLVTLPGDTERGGSVSIPAHMIDEGEGSTIP